jgi:hypothetical protein
MGLSHRQAVIALYAVCAGCALLSLFLIYPGDTMVGLILVVAGTIMCVGIQRLGYPEFNEISRIAQRTLEQRQIIANNVVIRKAARSLRTTRSRVDVVKALDLVLQMGEFDDYQVLTSVVNIRRERREGIVANLEGNLLNRPAGWGVTVDLNDSEVPIGQYSLGRAFRRRNVLVDVNLIFSELGPALTDACLRLEIASMPQMEHSPPSEGHPSDENMPVRIM